MWAATIRVPPSLPLAVPTAASALATSMSATVMWVYASRFEAIATNAEPTPPAPTTSTRMAGNVLRRAAGGGVREPLGTLAAMDEQALRSKSLWLDQLDAPAGAPADTRRRRRRRRGDRRWRLHRAVDGVRAARSRPGAAGARRSNGRWSASARPAATAVGVSANSPAVSTGRSSRAGVTRASG